MNKIANRAWAATLLAIVLFLGLCTIVLRYFRDSKDWYLHQSNSDVYSGGHLNSGKVYDRKGTLLLNAENGRTYPDDALLRRSTLHLLGDVQGNIPDHMMEYYSDELTSYDLFGGTQDASNVSMTLTVNGQIQKAATDAMAGRKGCLGIYNYKTGEVICMVSGNTYDPLNPSEVDDSDAYAGVYVNRFISSVYTPGSIFKVVTSMAAIEQIEDLDSRTFFCGGSCVINNENIKCNSYHGKLNFDKAVSKSCNVVFGQLAVELGPEIMQKYAEQAGIGERMLFDGFKTAAGGIDTEGVPENELAWVGIGQSTNRINPCQYMTLMGAIANGGVAAKPYVVSKIRCGQEETYRAATTMGDRIMTEELAARLDQALHGAVVESYGEWNFSGLYVGAKTGTAQRGGGLAANSLLTGYIKDEAMPYAFIVVIEGGGSGGRTCLPIMRQVINACLVAKDME